jgi:hypothetical protein
MWNFLHSFCLAMIGGYTHRHIDLFWLHYSGIQIFGADTKAQTAR